jgi:protein N-lysine methyltransferase METTL21A
MDDLLSSFSEDIVPIREATNLGTSSLTFDGLLPVGLKVNEDGGAAGCGGKLWPAGELLSRYLIRKGIKSYRNIVELGSGTGLVG